jgi:hypothetical protein
LRLTTNPSQIKLRRRTRKMMMKRTKKIRKMMKMRMMRKTDTDHTMDNNIIKVDTKVNITDIKANTDIPVNIKVDTTEEDTMDIAE